MKLYLNYRLDILSTAAMKGASRIYEEECGLNVKGLRLLRLIYLNDGIMPSELAERALFDRAQTSRLLNSLVDKGLVMRIRDPSDGRQAHLHLTKAGLDVRDRAARIGDRLEEALLAPLSSHERQVLIRSLEKLTAWVQRGGEIERFKGVRRSPPAIRHAGARGARKSIPAEKGQRLRTGKAL